MDIQQKEQRNQAYLRAIYDLTMGVLWTSAGLFLLLHEQFGLKLDIDLSLARIFSVAAVLYGLFRLYRGIKSRKQTP